jgi:hypothetical protein
MSCDSSDSDKLEYVIKHKVVNARSWCIDFLRLVKETI